VGLLLLVRHGQASFGSDDYDVLSETGWEQGRALGRHLAAAGVVPTALVRGGMRRHRETLEAMTEAADGAAGWDLPVDEDPGWDEFDHLGVLAADPDPPAHDLDRRAFQEAFVRATTRWADAGEDAAAYPETFPGFLARTAASMEAASARAAAGETVVVVTSGGVLAALATGLLGVGGAGVAETWQRLNTVCVNTGVTRVVVGGSGRRLLTFNEHEHLARPLVTYR